MMNQRKVTTLTMIGFRVDPGDLVKFDQQISKVKRSRSELLREIFKDHINNLKEQEHESTDFNCAVDRQHANQQN